MQRLPRARAPSARRPSTRRSGVAAAFALALAAGVLWPRSAWALPGPEIVLPAAVAIAQAWAIVAWAASRTSRKLGRSGWRGRLLVDAAVAALCLLAAQERGLVLVFALGLFGLRERPRARLALVAAGLGAFALLDLASWASHRAAPPRAHAPGDPIAVVRGRGGAAHPALRSDARVLLVGEREDFANCWVPGATLVRPADVGALPATDARDRYPTVAVLGAGAGERTAGELEDRRIAALRVELREGDPAVGCEATFAGGLLRPLMPFRGLWRYPNIPGDRLAGVPYVRPRELGSYTAASVPAYEVALTPTALLRARYGGRAWVVRADDLGSAVTAVRLMRSAGARVWAAAPERDETPSARPLLTAPRALLIAALALLGSLALSIALARREGRALIAHARGAAPAPWPLWAATIPLAPAAIAGFTAGAARVDAPLHALVTPSAFGSHTALHVGAFALLLLAPVRAARGLPTAQRIALQSALVAALGAAMWASVASHAVTLLAALFALPGVLAFAAHRELTPRVHRLRALERGDLGAKARELARAASPWAVPPGRVVFVHPAGPRERDVRALASWLAGADAMVRSTSEGEEGDAAAGMRLSMRSASEPGALRDAMARVRASYPAASGALPVLVMPVVRAERFGVALLTEARVLIEASERAEAVTAGEGAPRTTVGRLTGTVSGGLAPALALEVRALAEAEAESQRFGPGPVVIEWAERAGALWLLQARASGQLDETQAALESLAAAAGEGRAGAVLARRLDLEGVETPGTPEALRVVTDRQRRDDALGDALAMLGAPRWLAPERAVLVLGGEAFEVCHATGRVARAVALVAALRRGSLDRIAERIAASALRESPGHRGLRSLAAHSIALRLLAPLVTDARPEDAELPEPPSVTLARIIANSEDIPSRFAHWAPHELDRTSPRYGPLAPAPPALERPRPGPMSRARVELVRDHLRDLLAYEVARLGPLRRAVVPPVVPAPEVTLRLVEHGPDETESHLHASPLAWLSSPRAVEGTVVTDPGAVDQGSGGSIVVLEAATAVHVARARGAVALVVARGSSLSHAAMVARSLGLPMAVGLAKGAVREGQRLRIAVDGAWSAEGA